MKQKVILTTCFGIEDVVEKELKERDEKSRVLERRKGRVIAEISSLKKVLSMRSIHHVIALKDHFEFSSLEELKERFGKIDFSDVLQKGKTFRITCERVSIEKEHGFTSMDVQRECGEMIVRKYGNKVSLKNFDVEIRVDVVDNLAWVGVQLTKQSLHQRGYRCFAHPAALKPSLAYAMLRIAGVKRENTLLDPMCGGGTIAIEAALSLGCKKIFASDRNPEFVKGALSNAERAGIKEKINFLVADCRKLWWIKEVDKIVTNPPFGVRMGRSRRYLGNLYFRFLSSARDVVNECICLLTLRCEIFRRVLERVGGFEIAHQRTVGQGDIFPKLVVLRKTF